MTRIGHSDGRRRRIPRLALAASGATLLVGAGGLAWVQGGAGADPVSTDVAATCKIAGSDNAVTVPMTVDDAVDPVAPGGSETLTVAQGLGELPVEVTIDKMVVTTPIPEQIASTDSVEFEGGNMAGSYAIDGQDLVVTFTGPQSSSQLEFPKVVVHQTVSSSPTGDTIEWKVWSQMVIDTNFGQATCTPDDPSLDLNTTAIAGGAPSTTVAPGGEDPTTTTAPTTSSTTPSAPATPTPGASACVEVDAPVPTGAIPCPLTVPPAKGGGGGLPVPVPVPVPVPPSDGGGLPVPLPPGGGGLPLPGGGLPVPGGAVTIGAEVQIGVNL